jgi:transcriptional regulator with XRE-family HTH domain
MYNCNLVKSLLNEQHKTYEDLQLYVYGRLKGHDRYFYYATNPKADMLEKLADFFGVSIDYFFGRSVTGGQIIGNNIGDNANVGNVTIRQNSPKKIASSRLLIQAGWFSVCFFYFMIWARAFVHRHRIF